MHAASFTELSLLLAIGVGISIFMRIIRQPLIIGYIITGIVVGPAFMNLIKEPGTIEVFAQFGIALLLMIVGLGLNPRVIKEVGKIAAAIAFGKVFIATGVGFMVSRVLGFSTTASLFIGISMSFSSTIIILKLLSDKKEQNRLYGKISVGFLLVEDLIATLILIGVSATAQKTGFTLDSFLSLLWNSAILIGVLVAVRWLLLPRLNHLIAKSQEFLFLFAIGWGLGIAALFSRAGFSLEIGALLAGVTLASQPFAQEISSRLKPLRDFFIVLFFIYLGSHLVLHDVIHVLPIALLFSALVLIGNPIIVMTIMGISGYTKKTSFKTGITGAQISEFSFIMLLLAKDTGRISSEVLSLVTIVALITIAVSTYVILYADKLYILFENYLRLFERKKVHKEAERVKHYELVLLGYHRGGSEFLKVFKQLKKSYVVVDYDPIVIDTLENSHEPYIYGDVTDLELLEEINLAHAHLIVSTLSDYQINQFIAKWLEGVNPKAVLICSADTIEQAAQLYEDGAAYVMLPHYIGTEKITSFIKKSHLKKLEFRRYREKHLAYLQTHLEPLNTDT